MEHRSAPFLVETNINHHHIISKQIITMEFLEFTFQSGWHFLGVLILVAIVASMITSIFTRK
jgi:hypothetical protein